MAEDAGTGAQPDDGGESTGALQGTGQAAGDRTFTQEQLDRIVQERLGRERAKYGDYEQLKTKADEFDQLKDAQKTELEKAQEQASSSEREKAALSAENQDLRLRAAVISKAATKGIVDPDAAVALIDRAALQFDKDGQPNNLDQVLDDLLEKRPYLAGGPQHAAAASGFDGGTRQPAPAAGGGNQGMNAAIRRAAGRA